MHRSRDLSVTVQRTRHALWLQLVNSPYEIGDCLLKDDDLTIFFLRIILESSYACEQVADKINIGHFPRTPTARWGVRPPHIKSRARPPVAGPWTEICCGLPLGGRPAETGLGTPAATVRLLH